MSLDSRYTNAGRRNQSLITKSGQINRQLQDDQKGNRLLYRLQGAMAGKRKERVEAAARGYESYKAYRRAAGYPLPDRQYDEQPINEGYNPRTGRYQTTGSKGDRRQATNISNAGVPAGQRVAGRSGRINPGSRA